MKDQESFAFRELNPICFLRRILRELPTILAAGLAAAMLMGAALQLFYKPEYTSTATVAVRAKSSSSSSVLSDLSLSSEIADTFTQLFESNMFGGVAMSQLGVSSLPGRLSASVIPETNLLILRVTADAPDDAFRTLNLLLQNYNTVSEYVFQNVLLKELSSPTVPFAPSNPLAVRQLIKRAFLAGCAVLVLIILAAIILSDTVQTGHALRRKLDTKLLLTIHHEEKNKTLRSRAKKVNKGLLITMPVASFRFTEEIHRLATITEAAVRNGDRKIILVTSTEENEGKSTVAANLALALAQEDRSVLLIDADMHKASQFKLLEAVPKHDLSEIIRGSQPYEPQFIKKLGIHVLFSKKTSSRAAELLASNGMKDILEKARTQMDYIVIDSPPMALFSDVQILADLADLSVLVVRQDAVAAGRINDAVDTLRQCRAELLGCIFNDVRTSSLSSDHYGYGYGYGYGRYGYGYGHYGYGYGHYGYDSGRHHSSRSK
ncbi:MAG: polysaccharide biosynthesis tyrosine autokinase [Clostridia bacterium]|nr:polysaccharide biosynthesis tyrosine autokinase [Clostridia bacterium]